MESYCHPFLSAFAGTCGGEYESSPCFSRPMLQCMDVKLGSLTVSGNVPKDFCTARIPHFGRTVSFPLLRSSSPVCCVLSAIFYASLDSEWVLAEVPTWALFSSFWNILWQRQHSTMLCILLYTLPTTKWGEIKVYSACLRGSTVCIGNLLSTSAESVAYCCSLVLHVASIPKNMMN